jgi:hypothetical protein
VHEIGLVLCYSVIFEILCTVIIKRHSTQGTIKFVSEDFNAQSNPEDNVKCLALVKHNTVHNYKAGLLRYVQLYLCARGESRRDQFIILTLQ